MVDISTRIDRRDGVTFVSATVTNDRTTPQLVRFQSTIEPVWPPRRNGVVAPEWDGPRWEGRLEPESQRGVGFASPETVIDEPLESVESRRADGRTELKTREVLSSLSRSKPPKGVLSRR
ncbi:DUF7857 domain-containing protein [Halostagnicola bangensis]